MYLLYKYTIEHYHNVVNTPFIFFEKQYLEIKKGCRKQKLVPGSPALKSVGREKIQFRPAFIYSSSSSVTGRLKINSVPTPSVLITLIFSLWA